MSLADESKLLLIPSGYNSGKVYSVFPTDGDGDFIYTRSGDASRINPGGYIETVGTNIPRIDHTAGNCPSLLLEPQRTNLALYSEQFLGTNWTSGNTSLTSNNTIAPDNQLTADKLARTSTSGSYRTHFIYKAANAITYTTSMFIKQGSDNYFAMRSQGSYPSRVDIRFRFDTGLIYYAQATSNFTLIDYNVENYPNGWYRLYYTYTTDTHTLLSITMSPRATNGNIDSSDTSSNSFAYVWGIQTEVGNYLTSYIKTEGITVTRFKDECINGGSSSLFNITEGTFFVDTTPFTREANDRITLSNNNYSNRIFISKSGSTQLQFFIVSNYSTVAIYTANINYNERNKIAFTFKENEFKFYLNGSLVHIDTNGSVPTGLYDLSFKDIGSSSYWSGKIHDTRVYDRVLTEAEAIQLTTL